MTTTYACSLHILSLVSSSPSPSPSGVSSSPPLPSHPLVCPLHLLSLCVLTSVFPLLSSPSTPFHLSVFSSSSPFSLLFPPFFSSLLPCFLLQPFSTLSSSSLLLVVECSKFVFSGHDFVTISHIIFVQKKKHVGTVSVYLFGVSFLSFLFLFLVLLIILVFLCGNSSKNTCHDEVGAYKPQAFNWRTNVAQCSKRGLVVTSRQTASGARSSSEQKYDCITKLALEMLQKCPKHQYRCSPSSRTAQKIGLILPSPIFVHHLTKNTKQKTISAPELFLSRVPFCSHVVFCFRPDCNFFLSQWPFFFFFCLFCPRSFAQCLPFLSLCVPCCPGTLFKREREPLNLELTRTRNKK